MRCTVSTNSQPEHVPIANRRPVSSRLSCKTVHLFSVFPEFCEEIRRTALFNRENGCLRMLVLGMPLDNTTQQTSRAGRNACFRDSSVEKTDSVGSVVEQEFATAQYGPEDIFQCCTAFFRSARAGVLPVAQPVLRRKAVAQDNSDRFRSGSPRSSYLQPAIC